MQCSLKVPEATRDALITTGENFLVCLYNGKPGDKLDDALGVQHIHRKASSCITCVQPRILPPRHLLVIFNVYAFIIKYSNGTDSTSLKWTGDGR